MAFADYEFMLKKMLETPDERHDEKNGLTHVDRNVFIALVMNYHDKGWCNLPYQSIADMAHTSKGRIHDSLHRLNANGLIKAEQDLFSYRGWRVVLINDYEAGLRRRPIGTQPKKEEIYEAPPPGKEENLSFETEHYCIHLTITEKAERGENNTNHATMSV